MSTTDGLNLQQVQDQWRESQRLLDDIRGRLDSLASSSQSAAAATTSIQTSERTLAELVTEQASVMQALSKAQEVAVQTLEKLDATAAAGDFGRLSQQLATIFEKVESVNATVSTLNDSRADQEMKLLQITDAVKALEAATKEASSLQSDAASARQDLEQYKAKVERAIGNLPGRYQSKIREGLA